MLMPVCVDGASNEWSIVELQGNLVVDDDAAMTGVDIGTLRYVDGVPTIRIGNHILTGKVVKLPKPFAILQKDVDGHVEETSEDASDDAGMLLCTPPMYHFVLRAGAGGDPAFILARLERMQRGGDACLARCMHSFAPILICSLFLAIHRHATNGCASAI